MPSSLLLIVTAMLTLVGGSYCTTGVQSGQVCCADSDCDGTCGGNGCGQRSGGASKCCIGHITNSGVMCTSSTQTGCLVPQNTPAAPPQAAPPPSPLPPADCAAGQNRCGSAQGEALCYTPSTGLFDMANCCDNSGVGFLCKNDQTCCGENCCNYGKVCKDADLGTCCPSSWEACGTVCYSPHYYQCCPSGNKIPKTHECCGATSCAILHCKDSHYGTCCHSSQEACGTKCYDPSSQKCCPASGNLLIGSSDNCPPSPPTPPPPGPCTSDNAAMLFGPPSGQWKWVGDKDYVQVHVGVEHLFDDSSITVAPAAWASAASVMLQKHGFLATSPGYGTRYFNEPPWKNSKTSQYLSQQAQSEFTQEATTTIYVDSQIDAAWRGDAIWQWIWTFKGPCGTSVVYTMPPVPTSSESKPPCCLPHLISGSSCSAAPGSSDEAVNICQFSMVVGR